ncbi:MAG: hypothetical protein Fur0041_20630 [Bacteroidia bacterium]
MHPTGKTRLPDQGVISFFKYLAQNYRTTIDYDSFTITIVFIHNPANLDIPFK